MLYKKANCAGQSPAWLDKANMHMHMHGMTELYVAALELIYRPTHY